MNLDVVVDTVGVDHAGDCNGRIGPGVKRKGARNSLTSLVLHAAVASLQPDAGRVTILYAINISALGSNIMLLKLT